jgi:hypothetical protein
MKLQRKFVLLGLVLSSGLALSSAPSSTASSPSTGIVYGDSLAVQSDGALRTWMLSNEAVTYRTKSGTALCEWVNQARSDRVLAPRWIIVAFTGNTGGGTCAGDAFVRNGAPGAVENYRKALRDVRAAFPVSTKIYLVGSPAMKAQELCAQGNVFSCWFPFNGSPKLNDMYQAEARSLQNVEYVPDGAAELSRPSGAFWVGPCLPGECHGVITLRTPDGIHLTSAGSFRYALGMTAGLRRDNIK